MKKKILDRLTALDVKLVALLDELNEHSQEALDRRPAPGKWSAMDTLHHLRMAEGYAHQYLQKKLSFDPKLNKVGPATAWRTLMMSGFFKLPLKRKAPEPVNTPAFPEGVSLADLRVQWLGQRKELYDFIEKMDEKWLDKEVYKHPFAGRLGLNGMLTFFDTHFDRHARQAKRAVSASPA